MYRCDRPLSLGINLTSFARILRCAGANDSVKIAAADDGADVADFQFESDQSEQTARFQLKLMDIDSEHMGVPDDTEYAAVINMPSSEYKRVFTDLALIGDTITINAQKQSVSFGVEGDIGTGEVTMHHTEGADGKDAVSLQVNNPIKVTVSGKYLVQFTKACPLAESVTICMEEDNPIALEFAIPEQQGFVRYFLAPKIDNEEE